MNFKNGQLTRGPRTKGQVVVLISLLATFLISLGGLAVDLVLVYAVKTYLSTATDSAAMGGMRALERGVTYTDQEAEIQRITEMLFDANFPDGLLLTGSSGRISQDVKIAGKSMDPGAPAMFETDPNLQDGLREIRVVAEAEAPTMFMRILGIDTVKVRAGAYAARRDVNVMVVIDRSASLASVGAWDDVQQAAITFIEQFDNNRDRVGVVTFGTGGNVDIPLATGFKTGDLAKNMILSQTVPQSAYTNSGVGLWLAYSELLRIGDPNALNAIVFFTDGQPSAFTGEFDTKVSGSGPKCGSNREEGTLGAGQNTSVWNNPTFEDIRGFWRRAAGPAPVYYYSGGWSFDHPPNPRCSGMNQWGANAEYVLDPNSNWPKSWEGDEPGSPKKTFCIEPGASGCLGDAGDFSYSRNDSRLFNDSSNSSNRQFRGTNVHNAAKNLVLNIAQVARQDASLGGVHVHAIGLGGYGYDADATLMKRMANDPSTSYGVTITPAAGEPFGSYTYAPSVGDLQAAFDKVRSEVMRLTK
jgi:hypothetical protein